MFFGQVHLAILLRPRVWAGGRQPPTGKSAENGRRMARPRTVAPVHKLLLKTPNNPQHVRKICYVLLVLFIDTRFFSCRYPVVSVFRHALSSSNTTGAKYWDCRASFACTQIGADRAENFVQLPSLSEWVQTGLLHKLSNQEWVGVD